MWSASADTRRAGAARVGIALLLMSASAAAADDLDKYRLKPGARGKVCFECHGDFEDKLKLPFVHTPVQGGGCSDCHDPHASDHGKFLAASPDQICSECHAEVTAAGARSVHQPVADGTCSKCHDPHASTAKAQLLTAGNGLCLSCHKPIGDAVAAATFKHPPVEKNCLTCHDPHSSAGAPHLLKQAVPALCVTCHKPDQPAFVKQHLGYAVGKADCSSCHDPHGSSTKGTLWANVHAPVAGRMCNQCHTDPSAGAKLKRAGADLCRSCHVDTLNAIQTKNRLHWPVLDKSACLNCHNPHAARTKPLLRQEQGALCGSCHADAVRRSAKSASAHPPNAAGECSTCHAPHAANRPYLLAQDDVVEVCGACHDWQRHSTHPIGAKVIDPRNQNLTLDCLSCHRTHGSEHKYLSHFEAKTDLCVQCHQNLKR